MNGFFTRVARTQTSFKKVGVCVTSRRVRVVLSIVRTPPPPVENNEKTVATRIGNSPDDRFSEFEFFRVLVEPVAGPGLRSQRVLDELAYPPDDGIAVQDRQPGGQVVGYHLRQEVRFLLDPVQRRQNHHLSVSFA